MWYCFVSVSQCQIQRMGKPWALLSLSLFAELSRLFCIFFLSFITLAYAFAVPQLSWFVILLQIFAPSQELSKQGCILEAAIEASATAIINLKDSLNEWDSKVGDGDCGTTVSYIVFTNSIQCLFDYCYFRIEKFTAVLFRCVEVQQLFLKIWKSGKLKALQIIGKKFFFFILET